MDATIRYGDYGEILRQSWPDWVRDLERQAQSAGVYETGTASNRRRTRGTAISADVYGWDEAQSLVVVQVRQCQWRKYGYARVRKDYYLLGWVESGTVFAHPVESPLRSRTFRLAPPEERVARVLAGIWRCEVDDLPDIIRQGDIAFVPAHLPATAERLEQDTIVVRGSHYVQARHIWRDLDGEHYIGEAYAVHAPGEHARISSGIGIYRVQAGVRALVWGFSSPTVD